MSSRRLALSLLIVVAPLGVALAAPSIDGVRMRAPAGQLQLAQAPPQPPMVRPPTAAQTAPRKTGKSCRREPIWGFRMSAFCKPTGICSDRVIKGYRTVCS